MGGLVGDFVLLELGINLLLVPPLLLASFPLVVGKVAPETAHVFYEIVFQYCNGNFSVLPQEFSVARSGLQIRLRDR